MYEFKKIFKRSNRLIALLLSCFLSFGTVTTEYLEVQAFDWVAPSVYLPFDGAIPYLMGLLGVAPEENSLFTEEDYKSYLLENGYTEEDLENNSRYADWVDDVCNGALNQASEYWTQFKNWVKSLAQPSVIGGTIGGALSSLNLDSSWNYSSFSNVVIPENSFCFYRVNFNGHIESVQIWTNVEVTGYDVSSTRVSFSLKHLGNTNNYYMNSNVKDMQNSFYASEGGVSTIRLDSQQTNYNTFYLFPLSSSYDFSGFYGSVKPWDISLGYNVNLVVDPAIIDKLSFALSDAISTAIPGVIPLPWDQIGDTVDEITDTIDGLIEQVQAGVLSIEAYMEAVLEMVGAIAVDTATGLLYPQNPDKPDETIDDKANENKGNLGFTLFGLEKVFPFCIPFDIYAFLTLLVAEPVAPVINWPVYNPITQQNEIITIDFSTWNSVVVLFRYIFDFLFIIGMLLMARALIGGGDSA